MLLMIGSILLFILYCWNLLSQIMFLRFYGIDGYFNLSFLSSYGLGIVSSLLLMIGFIMLRGEQSKPVRETSYASVPTVGSDAQGLPTWFCPKCGKQMLVGAQFCGFCGWQVEGQKKR